MDKPTVTKGYCITPPLKRLVGKGRVPTPYVTVNCKVLLETVFKVVLLSGGCRGEMLC